MISLFVLKKQNSKSFSLRFCHKLCIYDTHTLAREEVLLFASETTYTASASGILLLLLNKNHSHYMVIMKKNLSHFPFSNYDWFKIDFIIKRFYDTNLKVIVPTLIHCTLKSTAAPAGSGENIYTMQNSLNIELHILASFISLCLICPLVSSPF